MRLCLGSGGIRLRRVVHGRLHGCGRTHTLGHEHLHVTIDRRLLACQWGRQWGRQWGSRLGRQWGSRLGRQWGSKLPWHGLPGSLYGVTRKRRDMAGMPVGLY